jgi:hypothetical protein
MRQIREEDVRPGDVSPDNDLTDACYLIQEGCITPCGAGLIRFEIPWYGPSDRLVGALNLLEPG